MSELSPNASFFFFLKKTHFKNLFEIVMNVYGTSLCAVTAAMNNVSGSEKGK